MSLRRTQIIVMVTTVACVALVVGVALVAGVLGVAAVRDDPTPARARLTPVTGPVGGTSPVSVLQGWDTLRAQAYADGDVRALRELYLPGSSAGHRDVRLLERYAARGLRVTGIQTQLLRAEVRSERLGRLVLALAERVTGARAVGPGTSVRLPQGAVRVRVVTLVQREGRWMVSAVSGAGTSAGSQQ